MLKNVIIIINFQSIMINFFCYFIETDNQNPIQLIIIHETSVRVINDFSKTFAKVIKWRAIRQFLDQFKYRAFFPVFYQNFVIYFSLFCLIKKLQSYSEFF